MRGSAALNAERASVAAKGRQIETEAAPIRLRGRARRREEREGYSREDILDELEENRQAALYAYPVQAAAATAATMGKAKVLGLIIEKSAVLTAKVSSEVLHGDTKEQMAPRSSVCASTLGPRAPIV